MNWKNNLQHFFHRITPDGYTEPHPSAVDNSDIPNGKYQPFKAGVTKSGDRIFGYEHEPNPFSKTALVAEKDDVLKDVQEQYNVHIETKYERNLEDYPTIYKHFGTAGEVHEDVCGLHVIRSEEIPLRYEKGQMHVISQDQAQQLEPASEQFALPESKNAISSQEKEQHFVQEEINYELDKVETEVVDTLSPQQIDTLDKLSMEQELLEQFQRDQVPEGQAIAETERQATSEQETTRPDMTTQHNSQKQDMDISYSL